MRANRERGEHGTENASSCSGPNGDAWAIAPDEYWEIQARALHQRTPNAVERAEILEAL